MESILEIKEASAAYAILLHNIRTYESGGVVQVVKGRKHAEAALLTFEQGQSSTDRYSGWRYRLVEDNSLTPGMDPRAATERREKKLERRERTVMKRENEHLVTPVSGSTTSRAISKPGNF